MRLWAYQIEPLLSRIEAPSHPAVRPKQAAGDLVAELHVFRECPCPLEGSNAVAAVAPELLQQVREAGVLPGGGFALVFGIGPGIGEMVIEEQQQTGLFHAFSEGNGELEIVDIVILMVRRLLRRPRRTRLSSVAL